METENTILLVDDEEGIRKVLEIDLVDAGYRVVTAENAENALTIFQNENPPIVLTDIKMPGMDGIELLHKIKNENPETEVIMITGHGDMDLAVKSLKYEATDFITKPISDLALEVALRRARERITVRRKLKDYTENLEKLLREKSALQDRLSSLGLRISSISHGIKGILTGLDGGIYIVDGGLKNKDFDRIEEGWDTVKLMVGRIRQMVQDILFHTKERKPNLERVDVRRFSEDVAKVIEPKMQENQVRFHKTFKEAEGEFEIDPKFIRSALINILENAIDACRKDTGQGNPEVCFTVTTEKDRVVFHVADNGIGIDAKQKEELFELFFSSKGSQGTGLGLYIANNVVGQHGGTIQVDSSPGKGARFTVELPRKVDQKRK